MRFLLENDKNQNVLAVWHQPVTLIRKKDREISYKAIW